MLPAAGSIVAFLNRAVAGQSARTAATSVRASQSS